MGALSLPQVIHGVITALTAAQIDYALTGALAYNFHAQPSFRLDIDVLICSGAKDRTRAALDPAGFALTNIQSNRLACEGRETGIALSVIPAIADPARSALADCTRRMLFGSPVPVVKPEFLLWTYCVSEAIRDFADAVELIKAGNVNLDALWSRLGGIEHHAVRTRLAKAVAAAERTKDSSYSRSVALRRAAQNSAIAPTRTLAKRGKRYDCSIAALEDQVNSLANALAYFNRKERNLLIRHALAYSEPRLPLDRKFSREVTDALDIDTDILPDAWWATDYHIDWLAGALAIIANGNEYRAALPNRRSPEGKMLIGGTQEDIDLVIASGRDLILIEAKGDSSFSNTQLARKLERVELVRDFYNDISQGSGNIRFHMLLLSPYRPQKLTVKWPQWAYRNSTIPWVRLPLANDLLEVGRCNDSGHREVSSDYWRIFGTTKVEE